MSDLVANGVEVSVLAPLLARVARARPAARRRCAPMLTAELCVTMARYRWRATTGG